MSSTVPRRNFEDFSESEKIDYWIERELPHLVHFIESWIDVESSGKLKVHFSRFDDFVKDPCNLINRLFSLYGAPLKLAEPVYAKEETATFRAGELFEWKRVFSDTQSRRATNMVPKGIVNKFDWG